MTAPLRIIYTGSRGWTARGPIYDSMRQLPPGSTIVHGGCGKRGANGKAYVGLDLLAHDIAIELGFNVEEHPADWDRHGLAAGPIRNGEMVAAGADLGLAFGPLRKRDGKRTGTGDRYHRMRLAGIHVEHFGAEQAS